jgi:hypothetical protein
MVLVTCDPEVMHISNTKLPKNCKELPLGQEKSMDVSNPLGYRTKIIFTRSQEIIDAIMDEKNRKWKVLH